MFYKLYMFTLSCFSKFLPLGPSFQTPLLLDHGVKAYGVSSSIWFSKWAIHGVHIHTHIHTHFGSMTLASHFYPNFAINQDKTPVQSDRH